MIRTVGIGQLVFGTATTEQLVAHGLGSCIAVILHDPTRHVGGLLHYSLPLAVTDPERAREQPAMFADTGIPLLLDGMFVRGCSRRNLIVKAAGGARLVTETGTFDIGRRNYAVLRDVLQRHDLTLHAKSIGGVRPRTVRLHVGTGRVYIKTLDEEAAL